MPVMVTFTIKDGKGKSSNTKIRLPDGFNLPQYVEFAMSFGNILLNLSEGVITGISIGVPLDLSGATIRAVASTFADVAEKALLIARTAVSGLFARFNIPTFDESQVVTGSDEINVSLPNPAALIAIIENGVNVGGTQVDVEDKRDNDVTDVYGAFKNFRKYG